MGLFKKNKKVGLISDIIRCDEPSYLIWKWHPDGTELGESKREYAIRSGSSLCVKDGEVAVFVYKQKDGKMQDFIIGPFEQKLKTANLPILSGIVGAFVGGDTPFQAEVYFINLAKVIQIRFAVPYFGISDFRFPDYSVPVAVRGTITFKISDYRQFIELHRLSSFDLPSFEQQVKDAVCRYVKNEVTNAPTTYSIPVIQIERKIAEINNIVEEKLSKRLFDDFGVEVSGVDIGAIDIDKSSDEYSELMTITKGVNEENLTMDLEHRRESLRIQREEGQYALHKQTQTSNLGAFQIEKQVEVGIAGAEALGKMGEHGTGQVNLGSGAGFNPASMMASLAVGNVVGKNIASTLNNTLNIDTTTPPPIPKVVYNVAKDGKSTGPFEISKLTEMIISGELVPESLVWKQGMSTWQRADSVDDIKGLFPPPI